MTPEVIGHSRSVSFTSSDAASLSESTSTIAPPVGEVRIVRNVRPCLESWCQLSFDVMLMPLDPWVIVGKTLIDRACLNAFDYDGKGTAAPQAIRLYWPEAEAGKPASRPVKRRKGQETTVQGLIERVRTLSGLTLEEIAPLAGVTRRSLQLWRAGGEISARKEQRFRHLADTLSALGLTDPATVRRRLFERKPHGVRPYDLLAEGHFNSAYATMTGRIAPAHLVADSWAAALPPAPHVLSRLSLRDDGPVGTSGRVDTRRSQRLKR